jgi:hypothetical protein
LHRDLLLRRPEPAGRSRISDYLHCLAGCAQLNCFERNSSTTSRVTRFIVASILISQIVDNARRQTIVGIDTHYLWNQTYFVNSLPITDE